MTLAENAIDFIVVGVEIYFSYEDEPERIGGPRFVSPIPAPEAGDEPPFVYETPQQRLFREPGRRRKHALLNLFSGVLLLLKESLRRIHENLLYANVGKPKPDANTITFDETVSRIEAFLGADALPEADRRLLRRAQRVRNSIEHYAVDHSRYMLDHLIPKLVEFCCDFAVRQLAIDILGQLNRETREHVSQLKKVAERLEREEKERCDAILEKVGSLSDEELESLADVEPFHPKHNPDPVEFLLCDECGEWSVAVVEDGQAAVCTRPQCRASQLMTTCIRCEGPIPYEDVLCEGCQDYFDRQ